MGELRAEYLFPLAHVCHITPDQVDKLTCSDFFQLIINIDQYLEAQRG